MRYLLLLAPDYRVSVNHFTLPDLKENLRAADVLARAIIGEYNIHEWDSSVTWDMSLWRGHELQLFFYGRLMAERLHNAGAIEFFEDLIDAYEGDPASAMERPTWTFDQFIIESHIGYLMSVTSDPREYGSWPKMYPAQHLPVPLASSLVA
jgi:hypothetical protein